MIVELFNTMEEKIMKKSVLKVVALLMIAIVACTALVSCGKKLSGTYEANVVVAEVSYKFSGSKVTLTVDPIIGDDVVIEGKYEIDEEAGEIKFTFDSEEEEAETYGGTQDFSEGEEDGKEYIKIGLVKYEKAD